MNTLMRQVTCLLAALCLTSCSSRQGSATLPPDLKQKVDALLVRTEEDRALANISGAAGWTLIHSADPNEMKKWEPFFEQFGKAGKARQTGDYSGFEALGGARGVEDKFAEMLSSSDGFVRGFGAVMLGVCGDANYVPQVAKLLSEKPREEGGFDLGCAAMGLGLLNAQQHKAAIAALLKDPRSHVAGRAALGLGFMKAKEYSGEVAGLLTKQLDGGHTQSNALMALAEMDARDQVGQIVRMLDPNNASDVDTPDLAALVLARLEAKEYAGQIAVLLGDQYRAGSAALALAVMKSSKHGPDIARLLKSPNSLVRQAAALALGVLGARISIRDVAALLNDKEAFVRPSAAAALLLMDAKQYSPGVVAQLKDSSHLATEFDWNPVLAEESQRQFAIAKQRLDLWQKDIVATRPSGAATKGHSD